MPSFPLGRSDQQRQGLRVPAMKPSRVEQAARNNAIWCDTVCRAHGVPGELLDTVWINRRPSPPYYPNLVTLRDTRHSWAELNGVRQLIEGFLPESCGVKDSFCTLDLTALGFELLFDASWIWCEALPDQEIDQSSRFQWVSVASSAELSAWEAAWSLGTGSARGPGKQSQFPPSLLGDRTVLVLAGVQGQHLVAGGIANCTEGVVGLSNVFGPPGDEQSVWAGLAATVGAAFPAVPLVGYQQAHSLDGPLACGFEVVGALRVWLR